MRTPAPLHVDGELLATKRAGAHRVLTLAAPGVPQAYRPGTFVALSRTGEHLARRAFWIHRVSEKGAYGPTLDLVVDPASATGGWLAGLPVSSRVGLTGPLGRPYSLPRRPVGCLLVGQGHSVSPLLGLAERLRARECPVTLLIGAPDEQHLLSALEARRLARQVVVVTEDGSVGRRGTVGDHVAATLESSGAQVVYAAGPVAELGPVLAASRTAGVASQVAVEQFMPCGTGLCHGCMVAVRTGDGDERQVRACLEGPVLPGDRLVLDGSAAGQGIG